MAIRVVYNYNGKLYAKKVPEGYTVRKMSEELKAAGATPIKAVESKSPDEAIRLASASPGDPYAEMPSKEERPAANRAADLAAMYGIGPDEALDLIATHPYKALAMEKGEDPSSIRTVLADALSYPVRLAAGYGYEALGGSKSREEIMGDLGPTANPSNIPTAIAAGASLPLSWPLAMGLIGGTQIATESLDPDFGKQNIAVAAPAYAATAAIPYAGRLAKPISKSAPGVSNYIGKELDKMPFVGDIYKKAVELLVKTYKFSEKKAKEYLDTPSGQKLMDGLSKELGNMSSELSRSTRAYLPVGTALLEEDVRANPAPNLIQSYPAIKLPYSQNAPVDDKFPIVGDLGIYLPEAVRDILYTEPARED